MGPRRAGPHGGNRGSRRDRGTCSESNRTGWVRVNRSAPCPICEHDSWCGVAVDGLHCICMRTESGRSTSNGGWLHRLGHHLPVPRRPRRDLLPPPVDLDALNRSYVRAGRSRHAQIVALGTQLGVHPDALVALGLGWSGTAWSWPMHNQERAVVGIRLRDPTTGRKWSVRGGREGVFLASLGPRAETVFIVEGPTDAAAILTLGEYPLGRPNCHGGIAICQELVRGRRVVVCSDRDAPGRRGSATLACRLAHLCADLRMIEPPKDFKDMREWHLGGASPMDLWHLVHAAKPIRPVRLGDQP